MKKTSVSPVVMVSSIWCNRELLSVLISREVSARYRGSFFGIFWSVLNPILMLTVYVFVFSVIFKPRWIGEEVSRVEFALLVFVGLLVFNFVAECIGRSPALISSNINYVKKIVFPLEILPVIVIGGALLNFFIGILVWLVIYWMCIGPPHGIVLFVPLVVFPLVLFVSGISWTLTALGVYVRDISQFIGMITSSLMFLSPIFYPISAIPERYRLLIQFNPISPAIEQIRNILFFGELPNPLDWAFYLIGMFLISILGFACFQIARKGFTDVL